MATAIRNWIDVPIALATSATALLAYLYYSDHRTLKTQRSRLFQALLDLDLKHSPSDSEKRANALDYLLNVYMQDGASGFTREDEKRADWRRLICIDFGAIETLTKLLFNMKEDPVVMRRCCDALRVLIKPTGIRSRNGLCRERLFRTGAIEQMMYIVLDHQWPLEVRASAVALLRRATYFTWFIAYMERDEVPRDSRGSLDIVRNVSDEDLSAFVGLLKTMSDDLEGLDDNSDNDDEENKELRRKILAGVFGTIAHISETTAGSKRLLKVGAVDLILPHLQSSDQIVVKHAAVTLGNLCLTDFESIADKMIVPINIAHILMHLQSQKRQTSALHCIFSMVKYLSEETDDEQENELLKSDRDMLTSILYDRKENTIGMLGLLHAQKASTREKAYKLVLYITQKAFSNNYDKMQEIVDEAKKREELRVQRNEQKRLAEQRRQQQMMMGGMGGGMGGMDQQMLMQMLAAQGGGGF